MGQGLTVTASNVTVGNMPREHETAATPVRRRAQRSERHARRRQRHDHADRDARRPSPPRGPARRRRRGHPPRRAGRVDGGDRGRGRRHQAHRLPPLRRPRPAWSRRWPRASATTSWARCATSLARDAEPRDLLVGTIDAYLAFVEREPQPLPLRRASTSTPAPTEAAAASSARSPRRWRSCSASACAQVGVRLRRGRAVGLRPGRHGAPRRRLVGRAAGPMPRARLVEYLTDAGLGRHGQPSHELSREDEPR